ncbi:hypothetical protein V8F20_002877 [Naviculisporaceae sp. PSN 640]
MTVTHKLRGPRGREFWGTLNLNDPDMLRAMINTEFSGSGPPNEIHYINSSSEFPGNTDPDAVSNMIVSLPCLSDCFVFLYRGAIFLPGGPPAITKTGLAYVVKDEQWIGLGRDTEIFIMEQGETKGVCSGRKEEEEQKQREQERQRLEARRRELELVRLRSIARREAEMRRADSPEPIVIDWGEIQRERRKREFKENEKLWDKVKRKVRREPTPDPDERAYQCVQQ